MAALDEFANRMPTDSAQAVVIAPPQQIVGAQKVASYRDERRIKAVLKEKAAAAGEDFYYRFPVRNKKKGTTEWIEGPSVKLANVLWRTYGNCEVDCRAQDFGSTILFYARFVDLENGAAYTRPFQQRRGAAKLGGDDRGRLDEIDFSIGASKATRNVVVNALPELAEFAFQEAKQALVEKIGKRLDFWRDGTAEKIGRQVHIARVEAVIGRAAKDWLAADVARVIAMGKAVSEGMATWDETFPPLKGETERVDKETGEVLDDFAAGEKVVEPTATAGSVAQTGGDDPTGAAPLSPPPAASVDDRPEIILKLLQLAAEKRPEQDRLEVLDITQTGLLDRYPADWHAFIRTACATAAQIIRGEMPASRARSYLEGLVR